MENNISFDFSTSVTITGCAVSGKSLLAKRLSDKYKCPLILNDGISKNITSFNHKIINNLYMKKICFELINKPKIIIFDDILTFLNDEEKREIIDYANDNQILIINVTTNSEELSLFPYIIILNNNEVVAEGTKEQLFMETKLFSRLKLKLPFAVMLSHELQDYQVIDKIIDDEIELGNMLWK